MRQWIQSDKDSYKMSHPIAAHFTYGENWVLFSYMRNLRYLEYYTNKPKRYPWDRVLKAYHWFVYRRQSRKLDICIPPNTVGPGYHL